MELLGEGGFKSEKLGLGCGELVLEEMGAGLEGGCGCVGGL